MSYQICYMLFNIQTTMSTRFKTEKSYKRSVNHHFRISVGAFAGSPYMISRDQLWYVMTSSASHGDALILLGTDASIRGIIILSLKINLFSGIRSVSELFDPPTHTYFCRWPVVQLSVDERSMFNRCKTEVFPWEDVHIFNVNARRCPIWESPTWSIVQLALKIMIARS